MIDEEVIAGSGIVVVVDEGVKRRKGFRAVGEGSRQYWYL
jgi:hypothetical protein